MNKINLKNEWECNFCIEESNDVIFHTENNGEVSSLVKVCDSDLLCSFWFDEFQTPCKLNCRVKVGDKIKICYLIYRIELYKNDILVDEEWPYGNIQIHNSEFLLKKSDVVFFPYSKPTNEVQDIIGQFSGAQDWHPEENVWVGDCMPFSHDGVFHIFYLKDRRHHKSKWSKGAHQWAHISSTNLTEWKIHPMAVEIDNQCEGSICTGSVIFHKDKFYAFYSIRMTDGSSAPICHSVSNDGIHFSKMPLRFFLSDKYNGSSVRDPEVFMGEDGLFHMFVTTSIKINGEWEGCLAHLISKNLHDWAETEPVLLVKQFQQKLNWKWLNEPECSDYFYKNGWYYLVSSTHYWMSKKPFSDWQLPSNPFIPCGNVPKLAIFKGRIIFVGFNHVNDYAGTLTLCEAQQSLDGTLKFIPLKP